MIIRHKKTKWEGPVTTEGWETLTRAGKAKLYTIISTSEDNVLDIDLPEVAEFRGRNQKDDSKIDNKKTAAVGKQDSNRKADK